MTAGCIPPGYRPRRKGSARFSPYYKVQFWRPLDMSWQDVQVRYTNETEARAAYIPGKRCRLMRVEMGGRAPVPGSDTGAV